MDIVAHTGAVRCVVVAAEDGHMSTPAGRGLQHQRNEMGLGFVLFAEFAVAIGTSRIEIAQRDPPSPYAAQTSRITSSAMRLDRP